MESLTATSTAGVLLDLCAVLILLAAFACLGSKLFNRYVAYYGFQSVVLSIACGVVAYKFDRGEVWALGVLTLLIKGIGIPTMARRLLIDRLELRRDVALSTGLSTAIIIGGALTAFAYLVTRPDLLPAGLVASAVVISLAGTAGIAALPPLGGFVSEWLIFQGLFQGFRIPSHLVGVLIVVAAACLGLTSGLAVNAFVRAFGIPFLGMPRTRQAAAAVVALGVGAPLTLIALTGAIRRTTGVALRPTLLIDKLTVIPAHTDFSAFSPTYLAVFLVAVTVVPVLIYFAGRPREPERVEPVWDGGIVAFKPRMQYSAMTFAAPVRVTFDELYQPSVHLERASDDPAGRSGPVHYEAEITPIFQRYLYRPVVWLIHGLARLVRPVQSGDVNLYLLYVFLVILIAYLLGAL